MLSNMDANDGGKRVTPGPESDGPGGVLVRIGIVVVSDRASRGEYEDRGGPAVRAYLSDVLTTP